MGRVGWDGCGGIGWEGRREEKGRGWKIITGVCRRNIAVQTFEITSGKTVSLYWNSARACF